MEKEYQLLQSKSLTKENDDLREKLQQVQAEFSAATEALAQRTDENTSLKNALYDQLYNEKIAVLHLSAKKSDAFFKKADCGEQNRLTALEIDIQGRIAAMGNALRQNHVALHDDLYGQLGALSALFKEKIALAKTEQCALGDAFSKERAAAFAALKNEPLTNEAIQASAKKNNMERFVGLNLINKLGIFLIVIGVIVASQYTYFMLSDALKGILMFALGGAMLLAGEFLSRKRSNIFSLGITSGGVAIVYVALAISYFGLGILSKYPAILLCILITVGAFVLATRYNAQVILAFALIGGYLPVLTLADSRALLYSAMAYFVVLNLLALLISFKKKWTPTAYIGLFLSLAGTVYVTASLPNKMAIQSQIITLLYLFLSFVIYSLIPIVGTYRSQTVFRLADVVLVALNTFFSSVILYSVFYLFGFKDYLGLLAVFFAVLYLLFGRLIEKKFKVTKNMDVLFLLTGLAFVVLIVPLQFGKDWLSLGWLAEGVALSVYGIIKEEKLFKRVGLTISGLCLLSFVLVDFLGGSVLFSYQYLAITLGGLAVLYAYIYKKISFGVFETLFKYGVLVNVWLYSNYLITRDLFELLLLDELNPFYLCSALAIVITFLLSYALPRIKGLYDHNLRILSSFLYLMGILRLLFINTLSSPFSPYSLETLSILTILTGTLILVLISVLSLLALFDLMAGLTLRKTMGIQWLPIVLATYFILLLTQTLITQYHLRFSSMILSILYVLTAFSCIILGFARRYAFLRRFGLGLAFLAVVKLFLIDLYGLAKGYQIISYFALGITLIAISFVYQYFNKKLDFTVTVVNAHEKNT